MSGPVSIHAVLRWLERIRAVDVDAVRRANPRGSEADIARLAAGTIGLTLQDALDEVCPPRLHTAVAFGPRFVRRADCILVCAGGTVVTVTERRSGRHRLGGSDPRSPARDARGADPSRQRANRSAIREGWEARP